MTTIITCGVILRHWREIDKKIKVGSLLFKKMIHLIIQDILFCQIIDLIRDIENILILHYIYGVNCKIDPQTISRFFFNKIYVVYGVNSKINPQAIPHCIFLCVVKLISCYII